MKRKIWLMAWIIFLSISWLGVNNRKIEAGIIHGAAESSLSSGFSTEILSQEKKKRQFSESEPVLITEINLYELNNAPYQLSCLKFDHKGRLFSVDYKRGLIYRFDFSPDWKKIQSFSFGKGLGQGPGEVSQVTDFKIFNGDIYLVDGGKGAIEIYTTDGAYKTSMRTGNLVPRKLTVLKDSLVIETLVPSDHLFYLFDLSGNFKYSFGEYLEKRGKENTVYQDNELSESFSEKYFYYLPRLFGFVALYDGDKLVMVKETIDGIKKGSRNMPVVENISGMIIRRADRKFQTVSEYSLNHKYLLIRAYDYEEKESYWDIYEAKTFNYLLSVKNKPSSSYFALFGNIVATLLETEEGTKLQIYDLGQVQKEASSLIKQ
ncbi:MAG TPA: hypothetical protein PKV90_04940 [Candidatus Saccharicenans sp.]|jgi:hypothetical protein|nr:hypothetical protein [Candidatus Saccharicenans sp.]HQI22539.1 hypothetical protein [Candidatus Saccharicenans sp.]